MKKTILAFILGLSLSALGVAAISLCNAKDIEYTSKDPTWDVDTVSDALNDLYKSKGSNTNDSCNNVAEPNLGDGSKLIPVIISDNGTITKVSKNNPDWYNYCEKKWANAVILNDDVQVPNDNQQIDMDNIESMFVWIPKYKYRLWNVNVSGLTSTGSLKQAHSIEIVFDTNNTVEEPEVSCVTPMESGNIGSCSNGEYMTHPAFISFDVDGFWVGKFETGYKNAINASQAQVNSNDSTKIIIKPDAFSWRSNIIKNMFEAAYNYERDLDSHMIKNTEWGAVAYLSHSKYGIDREVNINNNSSYKTGYGAKANTFQVTYPGESGDGGNFNNPWNVGNGCLASTTGNITGIYDMSGGAWEYVAAHRSGAYGGSGFSQNTLEEVYDAGFYDLYNANSSPTTSQYMILGDATGELGPIKYYKNGDLTSYHTCWYGDNFDFVDSSGPWFQRSGGYPDGFAAGQFYLNAYTGGVYAYNGGGTRLVLAGENKHPTN